METTFDTMGKAELRAACKAAGVSYGKLTVADMRAALAKLAKKEQNQEVSQAPAPKVTTVKKEAEPKVQREEQNGVKRPGPGKCLEVWEYLDTHPSATGKDLREIAPSKGWNANNASIEFYSWRKFNGISGRAVA